MNNKWIGHVLTVAVFGAASVALGLIKIPSPVGSIALDSLPGYFTAAYFNPLVGGIVGALGHLGSAATAGFPLGGMHIVVAVQMFFWCGVFGLIIKVVNRPVALIFASLAAIALNGIASPLLLVPFGLPSGTAKMLMPFLLFASAANVVVAAIAIKALSSAKVKGL